MLELAVVILCWASWGLSWEVRAWAVNQESPGSNLDLAANSL